MFTDIKFPNESHVEKSKQPQKFIEKLDALSVHNSHYLLPFTALYSRSHRIGN